MLNNAVMLQNSVVVPIRQPCILCTTVHQPEQKRTIELSDSRIIWHLSGNKLTSIYLICHQMCCGCNSLLLLMHLYGRHLVYTSVINITAYITITIMIMLIINVCLSLGGIKLISQTHSSGAYAVFA